MIIRSRSIGGRGLPSKLTKYLLHNPKNERAYFIGASGTAFPDDLEKSLSQMVMMAELSRSNKPLAFVHLSPDLKVDKNLTDEEWESIRLIHATERGLENQPYAWVQHEKYGDNGELRIHRHVLYQRYSPELGRMIDDSFDQKADAKAREKIEIEFGHDRTFQPLSPEKLKAKQFIENSFDIVEEKEPEKVKEESVFEQLMRRQRELEEQNKKSMDQGMTY
jgi:hypothetical protein